MANEIQITMGILRKDGTTIKHQLQTATRFLDQTTKRSVQMTKNIGTSEESVSFSSLDIATNGQMVLINNDATNYVEWGTTTTDYCGKIEAGGVAGPLQLNAGKTLYLKANTAACDVEIIMYAR
jgi:hypothetical protein